MASECDFSLITMPNQSSIYDALGHFSAHYQWIHRYVVVVICICGIICNICNIIVLTRPSMRTAVNAILCAIAFCDIMVMISNLVLTWHYYLIAKVECKPHQWSHTWAILLLLHSQVTVIGHSSSIWLSVAMACLRFLTLRHHDGHIKIRDPRTELRQSYMAIALVISTVVIFDIPNCLSYAIEHVSIEHCCDGFSLRDVNSSCFVPLISPRALDNNCLIFRLAYWIQGLVFKMVPCILLTIFITILVQILAEVQRRRERLIETPRHPTTNLQSSGGTQQSTDRTTRMLIAVICVFLAMELPQGIMNVITGMIGNEFRLYIYMNLGDLLDFLSLINSCLTFVIYCTMSRQYRAEFQRIFIPKIPIGLKSYWWYTPRGTTNKGTTSTAQLPLTNMTENTSVIVGASPANKRLATRTISAPNNATKISSLNLLTVHYKPINMNNDHDKENSELFLLPEEHLDGDTLL